MRRHAMRTSCASFAHRYPDRGEAMARAFATGVYTMQAVAAFFGVHYSTVSRAVRRFAVEHRFNTTAASYPSSGQSFQCSPTNRTGFRPR